MTIENIIALASAGFTREEIAAMAAAPAPAEDPKPAPAEDPKPAPAEDPKPAPAEDPKPAPAEDPEPDNGVSAEQMLAEILGLKKLIQTNNIKDSQMPQQLTTAQQADAAIAEIIRPHKEDKNNGY